VLWTSLSGGQQWLCAATVSEIATSLDASSI
jgi:hypothetical protein